MTHSKNLLDQLKITPITKLVIGDVKLRRRLSAAGFSSILDVFVLDEKQIDQRFDPDTADAVIVLRSDFLDDQEAFARKAFARKNEDSEPASGPTSEGALTLKEPRNRSAIGLKGVAVTQRREADLEGTSWQTGASQNRIYSCASDCPSRLPSEPFAEALRAYEGRARRVFDELTDRFEEVMVYQAYDEFATELEEIDEAFQKLFLYYRSHPRYAVELIDRYLDNIFLVYMADQARSTFDGDNLWGNYFEKIGIRDQNVQKTFKQVFINKLSKRNMPLYVQSETANRYYYTTLLHGGLSGATWERLWQRTLLPMAKETKRGGRGSEGNVDGRAILRLMREPEGKYAPSKTDLNILEKAPDSTLAPLLESAFRVATQMEAQVASGNEIAVLTSYGLPSVAMEALASCSSPDEESKDASSLGDKQKKKSRFAYLPMADLSLDPFLGRVFLRWAKQSFPLDFSSCRIDYYVDGEKVFENPILMGVGKGLLEAVEIPVKPQVRYDIELRLMALDDKTGGWGEISSTEQTFLRNKPGCFEFIQESSGMFRLRNSSERITRRRAVAYVVRNGLVVEPGLGMSLVTEYETEGEWDGTRIFVYEVSPGASGSVVDRWTGQEIAVWQESYRAKIDKRRIIGETAGGLDLYGYAPCGLGTNGGLPSVTIEAFDGLSALDDLEVVCFCDGRRISVRKQLVWSDEGGATNAAQITLALSESPFFDYHIERCDIEARQKSANGKPVFRYSFAVAPIQEFKPTSIRFEMDLLVAEYQFKAREAIAVTNVQGDTKELNAWGIFESKMLLKDEFLNVTIRSLEDGKTTHAKLALAAVDVTLPKRLQELARDRKICLADVYNLSLAQGDVKVMVAGWRYNRAAMMLLGQTPLFYRELRRPGEYRFNLLAHKREFVQQQDADARDLSLVFSVCYGDDLSKGYLSPAWTDSELLAGRQGFGFGSWRLLTKPDGLRVLAFDRPVRCDVAIGFVHYRRKNKGVPIGKVILDMGQREVALPEGVSYLVSIKQDVAVTIAPVDWLGNSDTDYETSFKLRR